MLFVCCMKLFRYLCVMSRKQLRDFDILELLGNGQDSDLSSLSGDDDNLEEENIFPTSELDRLLNDFTHFDDDDGNELFPDLFDVDIPTGNGMFNYQYFIYFILILHIFLSFFF